MGHTPHLVVSSAFRRNREIPHHCTVQSTPTTHFHPYKRTKGVTWSTEERNKILFPHPITPYVAEYESGCKHAHTFPRNRKGIVKSSLKKTKQKTGREHVSESHKKISHGYFQQKCFKCSEL